MANSNQNSFGQQGIQILGKLIGGFLGETTLGNKIGPAGKAMGSAIGNEIATNFSTQNLQEQQKQKNKKPKSSGQPIDIPGLEGEKAAGEATNIISELLKRTGNALDVFATLMTGKETPGFQRQVAEQVPLGLAERQKFEQELPLKRGALAARGVEATKPSLEEGFLAQSGVMGDPVLRQQRQALQQEALGVLAKSIGQATSVASRAKTKTSELSSKIRGFANQFKKLPIEEQNNRVTAMFQRGDITEEELMQLLQALGE